ncbi:hypothetical protein, partial [Paenibacillus cookii]|uniref:hypothetical protein n=1 Tax=Paenibacillus cookii TaxID=157839 RepID=UPI001BB36BC4
VKEANYTEPEQFIVRLASLGAVWQQGVIPQVQTTRWTGGYDLFIMPCSCAALQPSPCFSIIVRVQMAFRIARLLGREANKSVAFSAH